MYYTIYKITNLINDKFYIGKHVTNNLDDNYYGSGKLIKQSIKIYGKNNFKKEILFVFDNLIDMNNKEIELITEEMIDSDLCYNMGVGGYGGGHFKGKKHTQETKHKLSLKSKGRIITEEQKEKISKTLSGRKMSEETKQKLSNTIKLNGRIITEEQKEKISKTLSGRKMSEETKLKMSLAAKKRKKNNDPVAQLVSAPPF